MLCKHRYLNNLYLLGGLLMSSRNSNTLFLKSSLYIGLGLTSLGLWQHLMVGRHTKRNDKC